MFWINSGLFLGIFFHHHSSSCFFLLRYINKERLPQLLSHLRQALGSIWTRCVKTSQNVRKLYGTWILIMCPLIDDLVVMFHRYVTTYQLVAPQPRHVETLKPLEKLLVTNQHNFGAHLALTKRMKSRDQNTAPK